MRIHAIPIHLVLAALMSSAFAAEPDNASWLTDSKGCRMLAPKWDYQDPPTSIGWNGACSDGYLSGPGSAIAGDTTYRGSFERGVMIAGELVTSRAHFKGQFKNNSPAGHGILTFQDAGMVIEGEFSGSKPVGDVDVTYAWGQRYHGQVDPTNWYAHGKGRLTYPDDSYYEGDFVRNVFHGKGKFVGPDGTIYTGEFLNGEPNGHGVTEWPDGSRYEGEYLAGKSHGHGTHVYADGDRYTGEFVADALQGEGRMEYATGRVDEGQWKADKLHGTCKIAYANHDLYSGTCVSGEPSGHGRFESPADELIYEGAFVDGRFQGEGRLTSAGYAYEGAFLDSKRHGHGKEILESGEQYEGDFRRGLRNGHGVLHTTAPDGTAVVCDCTFKDGIMQGKGKLQIGKQTLEGDFSSGVFQRGVIHTEDGRTLEVDVDAGRIVEVKPDGSRMPVTPDTLRLPTT